MQRLKELLGIGSRAFGVFLLAGLLLAACGDDDDEVDINEDIESDSPALTSTPEEDALEEGLTPTEDAEAGDTDATEEDVDGDATEAETDGTPAEEDATDGTVTEEGDTTPTEEDMNGTEEDADGTETEEDGMTGTPTEEDDGDATEADEDMNGTPTEEDEDADMTATEPDGGVTATEEDEAAGTEAPTDGGEAVEVGETIEFNNLSITVQGAETFSGIPGVIEPESGSQFVGVDVTIENISDEPVSVLNAVSSMYITTEASDQRYDVDLLANAALLLEDNGILSGSLESGATVEGTIGFQVPEDAENMMLVLEMDDTGETVVVDISAGNS